ncbi:MAG TPA: GDSL-type esterase/lipase family protein [Planctomycetota bacterium]|nr:GDSL-type esterase/lipase family protein [Planctomycetota bacterium]
MIPHFGLRISGFGFPARQSATRIPHSASALLALALVAALWPGGVALAGGDDWWSPAWSHRKRVRVRLAAAEPLGFRYRPPAAGAEDTVAAEALLACEIKLAAGAAREIRVVDAGGNVLPCAADDPDSRGLVHVAFPARRTITGQLATPIQDGTKTVTLSVGRDKAVAPGTRFYALAGPNRIATLEVDTVEPKTSTARVLDKTTPNIAQGIPVESDVLTSAEYSIYYGNSKPEGEAPRWTPPTAPVALYGWRVTDGQLLSQLEESRGTYRRVPVERVAAAMRNSPSYVGTRSLSVINSPGNPLDYDSDYHVSVYESFFRSDLAGLCRFSVDSSAPAYLFVDGKMMAQRPSFFYQVAGNFEHRGKIALQEGYHHLLLCAVESSKLHNTRLGWQPLTATVFAPVPASFYLARLEAEAVGFETRDQRRQVCFAATLAPLSVVAENRKRFQFVQFRSLTPVEEDDATTYRWEFGDGSRGDGQAPGHLYEVPATGAVASFPVALHVAHDGKPLGQYQQTVYCDPRPSEKLNLSLDIVSFANIVYFDERTSVAVRLRNTGFGPVIVRAIGRLESRDDKQVIVNQDLLVEGKNENFCVLLIDMKQLEDKPALLELEIRLGGQRVLDAAARVIPFADLTRRGTVALDDGELVLGPGGPYSGVAWTGEFPTMNYEVTLHAQRRAGRDLCHVTFPVASALCTLRPRAWDIFFESDRWYKIRLRVTEARVEAWLDGRKVADVPRAAAQVALPLAFEAMKPFGVHAALNACVAVRDIAVGRIEGGAAAPPPAAPAAPAEPRPKPTPPGRRRPRGEPEPPAKPPAAPATPAVEGPGPGSWTPLFSGSLSGWKPVTETDLSLLQRGLGALYDYAGRRVMLSTEIEDADRHLEHVFSRYIYEKHFASRRSVLLFGDRMAPAAAPGKKFPDYVTLLAERLGGAKRPFQFVERTIGLLPTLADVVLFARTLQVLEPLPDLIVVSPGLADVQQAVGDRDFARSFDLMIDAVRATGKSIKVILVSPPPCSRNVRVSRLYTQSVAKLARDHHVQFLDLDALLAPGHDDWLKAVYAAPDAQDVFLDTPTEAAHRRIADAIEKLLER